MKLTSVLAVLALAVPWVAPVAAAASSPPLLPIDDTRGDRVSTDVIGVIAVLSAYALLWGAFAVALKIRALLDDEEDGAASDAAPGVVAN